MTLNKVQILMKMNDKILLLEFMKYNFLLFRKKCISSSPTDTEIKFVILKYLSRLLHVFPSFTYITDKREKKMKSLSYSNFSSDPVK